MSEEAETMFFWVVAVSGSGCSLLPIVFLEWRQRRWWEREAVTRSWDSRDFITWGRFCGASKMQVLLFLNIRPDISFPI
jgi:hypothetical protein